MFAQLEDVLLNVALLVQDTQLIVAINQLDAHVVARLAGLFVLVDQVVHFLLQRVNDQVELVTLLDLLPNGALLLPKQVLLLV